MRSITKAKEPSSLAAYRSTPEATYTGMPDGVKADMRAALAKEQHGLCAYCMTRIDPTATHKDGHVLMRVEHWAPQSKSPDLDLQWSNHLGSCDGGGNGKGPALQTCDRRKGDQLLHFHPAGPGPKPEDQIRYLNTGHLDAEGRMKEDLEILNLHEGPLARERREVFTGVLTNAKKHSQDTAKLRQLRHDWAQTDSHGQLKPFVGLALYVLDKKLAALAAKKLAIGKGA